MSKKQKENSPETISINGEDHNLKDLTQEQISVINHIQDLDRKITSSQFNLEQLLFGKEAFMNRLNQTLEVAK
tara:strand:+ start:218 stop:436 length:219 start_codon:yes stop_codon:yes gene_type:complete